MYVGLSAVHYSRWLGNFVSLGLSHGTVDDHTLVKRAVVVYAIHRATNLLRHELEKDGDVVYDMVVQFAREAVRGHDLAIRLLRRYARR